MHDDLRKQAETAASAATNFYNWVNEWSDAKYSSEILIGVEAGKVLRLLDDLETSRSEGDRLEDAMIQQSYEIEQMLGKALGYPKYRDDPKNFPGVTDDSVCVGDNTPESLAMEGAARLKKAEKDHPDHEACPCYLARKMEERVRKAESKLDELREKGKHQWWCGGEEPCACTDGWKLGLDFLP
jgi:hypothetical protein